MILTKNVNGAEFRLTITMNETHTKHDAGLRLTVTMNAATLSLTVSVVSVFMVTVRPNLEPFMVCVSLIHGYDEPQFGAIHIFGEDHSTSNLTL